MSKLSAKTTISVFDKLKDNEILERHHKEYLEGNRSALMEALITCSVFQKAIPDWVADELLDLDEQLDNDSVADLNEFFGFRKHTNTVAKNVKKVEQASSAVYQALALHRTNGGNFTINDGLQEVSEITGVSRRIVQMIYIKHKEKLKKLPKKPSLNNISIIPTTKLSLLKGIAKIKRTERDK